MLAVGAVVAVAAFAAANRAELPRPAGAWGPATDIAVIGLVVLGVTGVQVISPEDPGLVFERQIIQFHQDFFLGPANQVVHGGAMLVDTFSQYGVGAIYAIAGWFELVPVGNGTLGLFDGLLSGLVFAAAYGGPAPRRRLAAGWRRRRWPSRSFALVYGLLYPVGALLQHGAIRFGAADRRRWSARRSTPADPARCPRLLQLAALGISSIWALEAFAYTLVTLAAVVAVRVAMTPSGRATRRARHGG